MTPDAATAAVPRAQVVVDLGAIRDNVTVLRAASPGAALMAVVKADAYGHGLVPSARAAIAGGASWLGVALPEEAFALRAAGVDVPVLAWLLNPGDDDVLARAVAERIDLSASDVGTLAAIEAAAGTTTPARVHLKVDSGLGRAGAPLVTWPALVEAAAAAEARGRVTVVGVWSHLAFADAPNHPVVAAQVEAFADAVDVAKAAGLSPQVRHLANSAATLALPQTHLDLVRPGIAVYGVSPGGELASAAELGLRPAMRLEARLAQVKRVPAGHGVSYGHEYTTTRETSLGLVPLGYADGVPRAGGGTGPVLAAGRVRTVAGRICMDQFVLDLGDDAAMAGDTVVLFGDGLGGEPTAEDWAQATGTIAYEIVSRVGPRVPRRYVGGTVLGGADDTA
jgi:alanine racemase